jgi:hypothetical protein
MWRATAGECGVVAPLMERSDDGGLSWVDVTPLYRGIGQISSLDAFAGTEAETVASMGQGCETQALRTFTQGEFWAPYDDVLRASRYLDPAGSGSVTTPGGSVSAPCAEPHGFRAQGEVVALVCDSTAYRLIGSEWAALPAEGVAALSIDDGTVLTAGTAGGCSGAQVIRWTGTDFSTAESVGCSPEVDLSAPLSIAASGDSVVLWSGDSLLTVP